ncbi:YgcG family protein [Thiobacillus sp.]|uniref:TPM domain-containing protein n=1 Tax=Thiobacillus sp. TaxID=924 RepID=UPI0025D5F017|nr:YgcG family protein [Thiobacillus sp.]
MIGLSILNRRARAAFGFLLLLFALSAWAQIAVPDLSRRVTDLTGTLDAGQVTALENRLAAFEAQKGSQIAVLVVPTTQPEDIAQFGIRVAEQWKIGREKIDDGVILIVAKDDRKLRLEVGYGLEGAIPDAIAKRVIAETITPYFKAGDYYGGIDAGVQQLMRLIEGEPLPAPSASKKDADDSPFIMLIVGGIVAGWLLSMLMSRPAAGGIAALGSGVVGAMLLGLTPALLFIAVFVFAGVATGFRHGGGWSSGGGGGFGGGGGGSWGGGGGGFGGGGASGSW